MAVKSELVEREGEGSPAEMLYHKMSAFNYSKAEQKLSSSPHLCTAPKL